MLTEKQLVPPVLGVSRTLIGLEGGIRVSDIADGEVLCMGGPWAASWKNFISFHTTFVENLQHVLLMLALQTRRPKLPRHWVLDFKTFSLFS